MTVTPIQTIQEMAKYNATHVVTISAADVAALTSGSAAAILPLSGNLPAGTKVAVPRVEVTTAFANSGANNGTLVAIVGDGSDDDRFIASGSIKTAGFVAASLVTGTTYKYASADTVDIVVTAGTQAITTVNAGELKVYLDVRFP